MVDILPDDAPSPRLCHLIKWPDFDGYGFNLHAERSNPGQFIGKIDDDSPAKLAGLQEGDRIVEVNGVNISNENHRQVVERIKSEPNETRLLVVDQETDLWYKEQDLVVKSSQLNVIYIRTPVPRPEIHAAPSSPAAADNSTEVAKTENGAEVKHGSPMGSNQSTKVESQIQQGDTTSQSVSPTAMGSASLETSDFNDDSIEQAAQQQQQQQQNLSQQSATETTRIQSHVSPPMSPDSGKGDEVELPINGKENMVTIEAEINRQSKPQNDDNNMQEVIRVAQPNMKQQQQQDEEEDSLHHHHNQKQNHSHKEEVGSIQPDSLNNQAQTDDESEARKVSKIISYFFHNYKYFSL